MTSVRPFSRAGVARKPDQPGPRDADEHDAPADPREGHRGLQGFVFSRDLEGDVDRSPSIELERVAVVRHQAGPAGAGRERRFHPVREAVRRDDPRRADRPERSDEQEPHRPAPDDRGAHPGANMTEADRMERDPQRLEECHLIVADRVGDRQQQSCRPGHPFSKSAIGDAVAREAHVRAEVAVACPARLAVPACTARLERHPEAGPWTGLDDPADLVAEHERLGDPRAGAALDVPVEVGAAEPDRRHTDHLLAGGGDRLGQPLEPQVADAVEPERVHRRPR